MIKKLCTWKIGKKHKKPWPNKPNALYRVSKVA